MKVVLTILLFFATLQAAKVEIHSNRFEADQGEMVTKFFGNVEFRKGNDFIYADRAFIYFDKKKKPIKFDLIGSVRFDITKDAKRYKGHAQEILYYPRKKSYIFTGNVYIEQLPDHRKIYAQKVVLHLKGGELTVEGSEKKPVKMIFDIEEK